MKKSKRSYVQTARREKREKTRARIVAALVELHEEIGPKNTSIAAVAKRAGVQRLTVYRHFEDESAMFQACSGQWAMDNPPPLESEWQELDSPDERAYAALLAIARYYSKTEGMLAKIYRDVSEVEALKPIMEGFDAYFTGLADNVALDLSNQNPTGSLKAVSRHLARFSTWQSLSLENLSEEDIAQVGLAWLKRLAEF